MRTMLSMLKKADPVEEHRSGQYRQMLDRAIQQRPESLLIVGSSRGALLKACRQLGTAAASVESDPQLVDTLTRQGFAAQPWDQRRLPFADLSYDWVAMHADALDIEGAEEVLVDAMRVCRSGIVLAQQWFDVSLPDQAMAACCEQWLQSQRKRRGEASGAVLTIDRVMKALPDIRRGEVEGQYMLRWRERSAADLRGEGESLLRDLPDDSPERQELEDLIAAIDLEGLSWSGMLLTVVRKPRKAAAPTPGSW